MPASHAKLSPSSAHEWLNCSMSIWMKEQYGHLDPHRFSAANAQGTIKHAVIEKCLREDIDPYGFVGQEFRLGDYRENDEEMPEEWREYRYEFTEDDADTIMGALDEIDAIGGDRVIELRVDLGHILPDQFGTLDLGIIIEHADGWVTIIIWDNKFGRVAVTPVENDQLMIYANGFYHNLVKPRFGKKVRKIVLMIFQPTVKGGGGEWSTNLPDLIEYGRYVESRGRNVMDREPEANPGHVQCKYCIGAKLMKCEAYVKWNTDTIKSLFTKGEEMDDLIERGEPPCLKFNGVDPKMRSWIIENFPMMKRFVERLEDDAFEDAYSGANPVPGKKLVYGNRSRRKYRNQEAAEKRIVDRLGEEAAFTKKVIGPAQLEKAVGKKEIRDFDDIIEQGEAKLVLVDDRDARPKVKSVRDMLNED